MTSRRKRSQQRLPLEGKQSAHTFSIKVQSSKPVRKLGVALVGLGLLSTEQIAPALQKARYCRLAAIVTGTPSKARKWCRQYGIPATHVYSYDNMEQMADNPDIDFVYVVTPNGLHKEHVLKAALAGKHVFCEKPMANSVKDCQAMIAACKKAKIQLGIAYRCQFEPHHLECIRLARKKEFGKLKVIEAGFGFKLGNPAKFPYIKWRLNHELAGGGAMVDIGIYALQACRYLTGEEPVSVMATETKMDRTKFKEVDEAVGWTMKFPSGVIAHCSTNYSVDGINYFAAYAEKGWFRLDSAFGYDGQQGIRSDGRTISFPPADHFQLELDAFAGCLLEGRSFPISGEEGLRDARVIEAIYRSIRTGKEVRL